DLVTLLREKGTDFAMKGAQLVEGKLLDFRHHYFSPGWTRCLEPPLAGKPMMVERDERAQSPQSAQVTPCVLVGQMTIVRPLGVFVFSAVPAGRMVVTGPTRRSASWSACSGEFALRFMVNPFALAF